MLEIAQIIIVCTLTVGPADYGERVYSTPASVVALVEVKPTSSAYIDLAGVACLCSVCTTRLIIPEGAGLQYIAEAWTYATYGLGPMQAPLRSASI